MYPSFTQCQNTSCEGTEYVYTLSSLACSISWPANIMYSLSLFNVHFRRVLSAQDNLDWARQFSLIFYLCVLSWAQQKIGKNSLVVNNNKDTTAQTSGNLMRRMLHISYYKIMLFSFIFLMKMYESFSFSSSSSMINRWLELSALY